MATNNIKLINETLQILHNGSYRKGSTKVSFTFSKRKQQQAIVLLPEQVENLRETSFCEKIMKEENRCIFRTVNQDSYACAQNLQNQTHKPERETHTLPPLVLNFANPVHPGGGVYQGARAQEEDLCRRSTLLSSLESKDAEIFYTYHRSQNPYLASDAIILSPNVEIFRDAKNELLDTPIHVAVLTCAAPNLCSGKQGLTDAKLEALLYKRICGMVAFAAVYGYKKLVLGAWGCGAFGNDAKLVASLFYKAFKEFKCGNLTSDMIFEDVTFAVLDKSENQYNYTCFEELFKSYYSDVNKIESRSEGAGIDEKKSVYLDKIQGSLIGGAVGDALGYPVEFLSIESIQGKYGEQGITSFELDEQMKKALISDDTQMTLFTANGLLVGNTRMRMRGIAGKASAYVFYAYLNWLETQGVEVKNTFRISWLLDIKELFARRAPGNTCLSALGGRTHQSKYGSPENIINQSKGCGGIMRVAPVGLFFHHDDIIKINKTGAEIAAITHTHPLGYLPAAILTHIINRLVYGNRVYGDTLNAIVKEAVETVSVIYKEIPYINELVDIVNKAVLLSSNQKSDYENIKELGEGWVAEETLAIAIYCSLRYQDDFTKGIIAAVNHDGDSDSTGAVTGNILGALLGYKAIPDYWKKDLELKDVILELATDLCYGCQMSEYGTYRDSKWIAKYMEMRYSDR